MKFSFSGRRSPPATPERGASAAAPGNAQASQQGASSLASGLLKHMHLPPMHRRKSATGTAPPQMPASVTNRPVMRTALPRARLAHDATPASPAVLTSAPAYLAKSKIASGNPRMSDLFGSANTLDVSVRQAVFSDQFQSKADVSGFIDKHLNASVAGQLKEPAVNWNTQTFQALFAAAWVNHPTEKGAYMIDLSGLSAAELSDVQKAYKAHCTPRKSSHLDGGGRSASTHFNFLKGYKELLVQMPVVDNKPYLFLKAEGNTTGLSGIVPHVKSYLHKVKTGEGLTAAPFLSALAMAAPQLVEARAAENYTKPYEKLVAQLGFKGRTVTIHEMAQALFNAAGHRPAGHTDTATFIQGASNRQLGQALAAYCDEAAQAGADHALRGPGQIVSDRALVDLRMIAKSLLADSETQRGRVHREIITTPEELDASLSLLRTAPADSKAASAAAANTASSSAFTLPPIRSAAVSDEFSKEMAAELNKRLPP